MRQTRASARLAKSVKVDEDVPAPEADTNYVDKSDDDYSEEEVIKAPKRKRARKDQVAKASAKKKHVRGKQGRLEGLMNMPIDIFTEIARYLMPGDIITLARSNKFFRTLLMHRSAAHLWHGAMRNVPNLPPCPPGMSEPGYLTLVFSRTCSMCGSVCVRRMDETLRVRLCVPCRNSSAVPLNDLPSEVITLVHFSTKLVPSKRRWGINPHALRDDADMVTAKLKELEESKLELEEWKEERLTELKDRREQSIVLAGYLDSVESCRDDELSQRRVEFRLEVERRLLELDWKPKDFEFPWNRRRDWTTLVDQPKVLTDRIWTNLKPKLIPVLERNRAARLEREMAERKASRRARLSQLLNDIKLDAVPNVHATMIRPTDTSSTRSSPSVDEPTAEILHKGIFPDFVDALEWPIFKSLYETDVPIAEVMARFDEQRDEIGMLISDWIERVEEHMAERLRKGRVSDGLPEEAPEPTLPVEESALKPFRYLSDDQKLLYRADSFFEPTKNSKSPSVACFFDAVVSSGYLITYGSTLPMRPVKKPFDVTSVKRNADAQATARILLASLGKPNASFLEMRCPGQGFACGRCHDGSVKTWEDMVHHYVTQKRQWNDIQPSLSESGITYHNLHDPEMDTSRPLVKLVMPQDVLADMTGSEPRRVCKVCIKISGLPVVRGAESKIITHVKEVHGIESPEFLDHYGNYFDLPGLLSAMFNDDVHGPYDSDDDGYGFLGPGYDSEEEYYGMW